MKRTTALLLMTLALTGCRLFEQQRHAAANTVAMFVVRSLFDLGAQASPSPAAAQLAAAPAAPALLPVAAPQQPARVIFQLACLKSAAAPQARRVLSICRVKTTGNQKATVAEETLRVVLDENGNAAL
jgi:hypothetical protein